MTRIAKKKKTTRLNIELSLQVRKRLENLREQTDSDSLTEVIRRSITIYGYLHDGIKQGGSIILRHQNGSESEVVLL